MSELSKINTSVHLLTVDKPDSRWFMVMLVTLGQNNSKENVLFSNKTQILAFFFTHSSLGCRSHGHRSMIHVFGVIENGTFLR